MNHIRSHFAMVEEIRGEQVEKRVWELHSAHGPGKD